MILFKETHIIILVITLLEGSWVLISRFICLSYHKLWKKVYSISWRWLKRHLTCKFDMHILLIFFFALLHVCCGFWHVSNALVSFHALFPLVTTKVLHGDTADCTWVQTVWRNTYTDGNHKKRQLDEKRQPTTLWQKMYFKGHARGMSCVCSKQLYRIHRGWSVECRNFEHHRSYRRCVSQHEC